MSNEIDISLDGVDRDNPEQRPRSARYPKAERLLFDHRELEAMSESDKRHYSA